MEGKVDLLASKTHYGFLIEITAKKIKQSLQQTLFENNIDLTVDQWVLLDILYANTGLSQQEVGKICHKDAATLTRIIDIMVKKQLVIRNIDAEDRRKFILSLSNYGIDIYLNAAPIVEEFRKSGILGLHEKDINELSRILTAIHNNMNNTSFAEAKF